jgi:hypothetical protein
MESQYKTIFYTFLFVTMIFVGIGFYSLLQSIRSNGDTDYCYIEMWSPPQMAPQYQLWAHRPWRQDRNLGVYPSVDEAAKASTALGCKLNSSR